MTVQSASRIAELRLMDHDELIAPDHMQREQQVVLKDILQHSHFQPVNDDHGPYALTLSIEDGRLVFRTRNARSEDLTTLVLSLKPYKRLIQDYFLMIESYEHARRNLSREKLEAIDMGRRGIHNEGAELLMSRLSDKITMDHDTARRLFTLLCVLHKNHARMSVEF